MFIIPLWNISIFTVRRSSTKKSDYFTKRFSQPQLDTGHEFTFPPNHPHQYSPKQIVSPAHSPSDIQRGLEVVTGNKRKPYLNRRSQLYRLSCDDYHSNSSGNTIAVGSDRCRFDDADEHFDWNKMQSDSVSSSSSAQNRSLTESDGTEPVATNAVDLATDNLPAVDTPDACDKAALR